MTALFESDAELEEDERSGVEALSLLPSCGSGLVSHSHAGFGCSVYVYINVRNFCASCFSALDTASIAPTTCPYCGDETLAVVKSELFETNFDGRFGMERSARAVTLATDDAIAKFYEETKLGRNQERAVKEVQNPKPELLSRIVMAG
jgi:hypothetical protein